MNRIQSLRNNIIANYNNIKVETYGKVALITLNRHKTLNALCDDLINDINDATQKIDRDNYHGAIVLTGSEKAFAAGADIKQMQNQEYPNVYTIQLLANLDQLNTIKKPIIAAVNGFALGGGFELAMMCDIIVAGQKAKFGLPELKLSTIPGCGGTQRLIRAIGKSKAMHYILTSEFITAEEAEKWGLVSKVFPVENLVEEAIKIGNQISNNSKFQKHFFRFLYSRRPIVALAKECINSAENLSLSDGLKYEKVAFYSTFATVDRREGMTAFIEKREPKWKDN